MATKSFAKAPNSDKALSISEFDQKICCWLGVCLNLMRRPRASVRLFWCACVQRFFFWAKTRISALIKDRKRVNPTGFRITNITKWIKEGLCWEIGIIGTWKRRNLRGILVELELICVSVGFVLLYCWTDCTCLQVLVLKSDNKRNSYSSMKKLIRKKYAI